MGDEINIFLLVVQYVMSKKLGTLDQILHNFALDLRTHTHILIAVLRLILEYDCDMSNINKCPTKALESVELRACKYVWSSSVTTCDEPVCVDLGLKTLRFSQIKVVVCTSILYDDNSVAS